MADEEIRQLLKSLITSNEEVKAEIRESREALSRDINNLQEELRGEIKQLKQENESLKEEVRALKTKLRKGDREAKKFKLLVHGIEEKGTESDITTCLELFNQKLNIDCRFEDLRNLYRIGKLTSDKKRPISIETSSYFLRGDILKNTNKLKGSTIYITPEYSQEDYEDRKVLRTYLKEARQNKQEAIIKENKLIIEGTTYTLEELKQKVNIHKRKASLSEAQEKDNPTKRVTRNQTKDLNNAKV